MQMRIEALRRRLDRLFSDRDPIDFSLTATCLVLAVDRYNRGIAVLFALAAMFYRPLQKSALFWLLTAAAVGWGTYQGWPLLDNHKYLINYWVLALGFCFLTAEPEAAIAANARALIGLTFSLAVLQKVASPDYLDGTYFHFQLLKDSNMAPLVQAFGGLSREVLDRNYAAILSLQDYSVAPHPVALSPSESVRPIAVALTWWTLAIEVAVAVVFLWPRRRWVETWRDPVLLVFLFTTYLFAHVAAFGWILTAMALAQTKPPSRRVRLLYVLAFLAVFASLLPKVVFNWDVPG